MAYKPEPNFEKAMIVAFPGITLGVFTSAVILFHYLPKLWAMLQ